MSQRSREQQLIDVMFEVLMKAEWVTRMNREERASWLRAQLIQLGFDVMPMGMSWAVLQEPDEPNRETMVLALRYIYEAISAKEGHINLTHMKIAERIFNNVDFQMGWSK